MTLSTLRAKKARSTSRIPGLESSTTADVSIARVVDSPTPTRWGGASEAWMSVESDLYCNPYGFLVICFQPDSPTSSSVDLTPGLSWIVPQGRSNDLEALSPAEQLRMIAKTFNLSKAELARALDVSRQAIYDWLASQSMSPQSEERVRRLAQLAWKFGGRAKRVLPRRPLITPVREGEPSILDLLTSSQGNYDRVEAALSTLLEDRVRGSGVRGSATSWLRSLGFRDPSQKERDANLGHNLFLGDLHRP